MKKRKIALLITTALIGSLVFGTFVSAAEGTATRNKLKSKGRIEFDMNNDGDYNDDVDVVFDASDMEQIADKIDEIKKYMN